PFARPLTSNRVQPRRIRRPPLATPRISRSITRYPRQPVTGSVHATSSKTGSVITLLQMELIGRSVSAGPYDVVNRRSGGIGAQLVHDRLLDPASAVVRRDGALACDDLHGEAIEHGRQPPGRAVRIRAAELAGSDTFGDE